MPKAIDKPERSLQPRKDTIASTRKVLPACAMFQLRYLHTHDEQHAIPELAVPGMQAKMLQSLCRQLHAVDYTGSEGCRQYSRGGEF